LARGLWLLAAAVLFVVAAAFVDGAQDFTPAGVLGQPWAIVLNALPGILLAWLILVLSRRVLFSCWIAFVVYGVLEAVNRIKIANLRTPLLPQDAKFLQTISAGAIHLFGAYAGSLLLVAMTLVALVICSCLLYFLEAPLFRGSMKRMLLAALLVCALLALGPVGNGWRRLYGSGSYFSMLAWSPLETDGKSGLFNELVAFSIQYHDAGGVPHASVRKARKLLDDYAGQIHAGLDWDAKDGVHPDIVIVQSEAFFDPSVLNRIDPGQVLPRFHVWQARGATGWLHVPTFGGGTIRTEFEVMTGISLRSMPSVEYPYLRFSYPEIDGLVSVLDRHGYDTRSIHANDAGLWNREAIFRAFGFKHRTWRNNFTVKLRNDGRYVSDQVMTDQILDELQHRDSNAPRFIFAISIENHGPYAVQPGIDRSEWKSIQVPVGLDEKTANDFRSYLYHLNHADIQLDRLLKYVMASPRPTIVLFYGDHLPALSPVFKQLGFRDGIGMQAQPVPWLMVANYGDLHVPGGDLAAWMLPGIVLHAAGVNDDAFLTLKRMLPRDLAYLTHSPWIKTDADEQISPTRAELLSQVAQVDRLRLSGKFKNIAGAIDDGGAAVRVTDSMIGHYVTPDYRIGGIATDFPADSPLFAAVSLAGKAPGVHLDARILRQNAVFREASAQVDVDGAAVVNLDLQKGRALTPGRYQVNVLLDGKVAKSCSLQIH